MRSKSKHYLLLITVIVFASGYFYWFDASNHSDLSPSLTDGKARIVKDLKVDGDQFSAVVRIQNENVLLRKKIMSKQEKNKLEQICYGDIVVVKGSLDRPQLARNFNQFDYRRFLKRQQIHWCLQAERMERVGKKNDLGSFFENLRESLRDYMTAHFSVKTAPYAAALVIGDKSLFEEEMYSGYQKLGVVHLLAISGLHVNLFIALCYVLLLRFGWTRELAGTVLLLVLPVYALIAGAGAPVLRACGMSFLILLGLKLKWYLSPISAISAVFLASFCWNPYIVFDAGFQLSYAVSYAILLARPIFQTVTGMFKQEFFISLVASLGSAVVLLFHFFEFSLAGVLLNLLYIPLFSVIIVPLVFLNFLLAKIPVLFALPHFSLEMIIWLTEKLTDWFQILNWTTFTAGKPGFWIILILVGLTCLIFILWEKQHPRFAILFVLVFSNYSKSRALSDTW